MEAAQQAQAWVVGPRSRQRDLCGAWRLVSAPVSGRNTVEGDPTGGLS